MQLHIDPHDRSPVYRQIQHQIARAIAERRIPPGEPLIDERALAVQLAVSPAAVRKAYRELKSERLCEMGLDGELRVAVPSLDPGSRADLALTLLRKELLTDELRAAREIQQRLLPAADLFGDSWSIHGRSFPAGLLAGDFREIVEHPDGTVDLIVGDVAGKGLGAGMIMAVSRSLIAAVTHHPSPDGALQELNRRLRPILGHRDFVALAWVRFEPATGTVQIANAGLPDPYVLRADGRIESLPASGNRLPLGVREELAYCFTSRILGAADHDNMVDFRP